MNKTLPLALLALLLLPSAASAATATADVRTRAGVELGPVTFKAAKSEKNDVTVTYVGGRLRFHDDANRVRAQGDCEQVNRRTAICPSTEDIAQVRLGNRDDRATVEGLVTVFGGDGNDVLRGSGGDDRLDGERGNDTLHGLGRGDDLTGGPGRDRLYGGSGDDDLFDGETDAQAAADLFRGGSSRDTRFQPDMGDTIDYSKRKRALDIDLSRGRVNFGRERDVVRGLESIVGGSGNDRLSGDGDDNWLDGNGGADRLRGRQGDDLLRGDGGNDRVSGEDGNDYVSGESGKDALSGGGGNDQVTARDSTAETVECGTGEDVAVATRLDTLRDCEVAASSTLNVRTQPDVQGDRATFGVSCPRDRGCSGALAISSLSGEPYGSGDFAGIPHGVDVFTPVEVDLTQAGREALRTGEVILVTHGTGDGGFRAFMRSG
jgi:Ca2+-binding RTX toxin-like protein